MFLKKKGREGQGELASFDVRETIEERRGAEPLLKVGTCRNHAKLVTNNNLKNPKIRLEI